MNNSFSAWMFKHFYHSAVKAELKRRGFPQSTADKIISEYDKIAARAKDIGKSRLISSYTMGIYFIAMNRRTGKDAEENFEIFRDGLCASKLFRKAVGNAESYLDEKKMAGRLKWSEDSHKSLYENDWVLDILPGNGKICSDEGCSELAKYLCRMDFVLADIMGMKLVRTGTIAEGADICDFRYSRK